MKKDDEVLKALKNTELYEKIVFVDNLYEQLNLRQDEFCSKFNIHCKKDCGSCCEHFNPDITELEALYLAYGLIKDNKDQEILELINNREDDLHCPLFNKYDVSHHCTVYSYRPLICRLFNASVNKNKTGEPVFRKCKWNEIENEPTTKEFLMHNESLVIMSDYGEQIENEEAGNNRTELLSEALVRQINKLKLYLELINEQEK